MHPRQRLRRAFALPRALAPLIVALAMTALAVAAVQPARAAEDGLALVTQATYVAAPAEGRIHVSIDAVATALTPDTATQRTYYSGMTLVIQPGAVNAAAATAIGNPLPVSIDEANDDLTAIAIAFDRQVFYQQRYPFTVSFDLPDPGGQPNRDIRIGSSLVAFPVWAFGSPETPGSHVEVYVPNGYTPTIEVGDLAPTDDGIGGATVLRSGQIGDALSWFAYVTAEAPGAFSEQQLDLAIGDKPAQVVIRGWEDDPDWTANMTTWMRAGIPELSRLIGLPWPIRTDLEVEEAATSRLGGYAGVYDDLQERINIRYDADAFVALHEAAHAWFNGRLIEDRWVGEAFASLYAVEAGTAAGLDAEPYRLSDDLEAYRIPLNAWGEIGAEDDGTEDFAYAATYEVARLIADRATIEGLQGMWQAIDAHRSAYQPRDPDAQPEGSGAVTQEGWQRLLDFVEEQSGEPFDDIWRDWVVTDVEAPLLDERRAARERYAATLDEAGEWELPRGVRHVMAAWEFEQATDLLVQARDVLRERDRIVTAAAGLDLEPPRRLESLFETASTFDPARAEAAAELLTLDGLSRATERLAEAPTLLETVGLWGSDAPARLAAARAAFEAGDGANADHEAKSAIELRDAARESGRDRLVLGGAGALALDGLALVAVGALRQRRRRRPAAPISATPLRPDATL
ncbi:MAG: hypothetical protein ABI534_09215 [Chloroflexota bacterium]